jgi:hypothetical protein
MKFTSDKFGTTIVILKSKPQMGIYVKFLIALKNIFRYNYMTKIPRGAT